MVLYIKVVDNVDILKTAEKQGMDESPRSLLLQVWIYYRYSYKALVYDGGMECDLYFYWEKVERLRLDVAILCFQRQ